MKTKIKICTFFAILSCVLAFSTNKLLSTDCNATPDGCPNCTPSSWSSAAEKTLGTGIYNAGDRCFFEIKYKTRACYCNPDTIKQIRITKIEMYGGRDCGSFNEDVIMNQAVKQILYESCVILDIVDPSSNYNFEVITPACMEFDGLSLEACTTACCVSSFTMRIVSNKVNVISNDAEGTTYCNSPGGQQCASVCGMFDDIPEGPLEMWGSIPDCVEGNCTNWIKLPFQTETGSLGNCDFTVYYHTCITGVNDPYLRIDKIVLSSVDTCSGTTTANLITKAIKIICNESLNIFGGTTPFELYIQNESCWDRNGRIIAPCPDDDCCWAWFQIRTDQEDRLYIYYPDYGDFEEDCSEPCIVMCDAIYLPEYTLLPKLPAYEIEEEPYIISNSSYVKPNPTSGKTEIHFLSSETGNVNIKIFDSMGNLIIDLDERKAYNESVWEIDAGKFFSGVYHYKISIGNKILITDQFAVIR